MNEVIWKMGLAGVVLAGMGTAGWAQTADGTNAQPGMVALSPEVRAAMGVEPLLARLDALRKGGQGETDEAVRVRQQVMERLMRASFAIDSVIARIDTEASYMNEDRFVLEGKQQHKAAMLNVATFAVGGALGAAGSSMQLTAGLDHAGTAVSAASGGATLALTAVQLKGVGGRQPIRTPYNMLAEVLGREPNAESAYPKVVMAYLHSAEVQGNEPVAAGLTAAWQRLGRLQANGLKGNGSSVGDLVADRASGAKLQDGDLADREAMLHDLHAVVIRLRTEMETVLLESDPTLEPSGASLPAVPQ